MEKFWPTCLSRFEQELSAQQFNTWIKPLQLEIGDNAIRLLAPNKFVQQWVKDRFLGKIETIAAELLPHNTQIELAISDKVLFKKPITEKSNKNSMPALAEFDETKVSIHSKVSANRRTGERSSGLNPSFNFNNYVTGRANQLARAAAIQVAENPGQAYNPLFIYGGVGLGKTHLLQALCAHAGEQQRSALYLPLRELHRHGPELLQGAEHLQLVCLDDVGVISRDAAWNRALFNLHRDLEERGIKLLLADEQSPTAMSIQLPDLASRILAGTLLRLQPLGDASQIEALQLHAHQRGLTLPDDVVSYLLRRLPRDMHSLCGFLDELDIASLTAQRKLTVPFVKQVLAAADGS